MYNPYDFYFKQAKRKGFKARSIFKLEEIDKKYNIFDVNTKFVMDIWCAPGSWLQYVWKKLKEFNKYDFKIVWFDLKEVNLNLDNVYTYSQDVTQIDNVENIIKNLWINKFDVIISDMAPNTIWIKDIDAIRSINLIQKTLPIYGRFLRSWWKIVVKIFMWPWFDDLIKQLKTIVWSKKTKILKPSATRKNSKEVYFIKY